MVSCHTADCRFHAGGMKDFQRHWNKDCEGHHENGLGICPDGSYLHTLIHGVLQIPVGRVGCTAMEEEPAFLPSCDGKTVHEHSRLLRARQLLSIVRECVCKDDTTVGIRKVSRTADLSSLWSQALNKRGCSFAGCKQS